ncbi:hypothetical protein FDUTEX481_04841 [Tolypothrix sp. PCC 7601]|nr:hypothetical protein FDUTEX481_04841 [Tolypothrix sp. PCC 7601]
MYIVALVLTQSLVPSPQSPIPSPQSPVPSPQSPILTSSSNYSHITSLSG